MTYINQTSQGKYGGEVIQNFLWLGRVNKQSLVGIHVSGYFQQSKCTLLVKSNIDWIKSFWGIKKKDAYQNLPWQERILNFLVKLENVNDELIISDLECFPVTSKLIGFNSQNTTLSKVKINLKLDELNNDTKKIHDRIKCVSNIILKGSNITSLDLSDTKFDMENNGWVDLCSMLPGSSLKTLNLYNCGITSLEPICKVLLDTQLEELNLGYNKFKDNGLVDLCSVLPGSSLKNLDLCNCGITSLEPMKVLTDTKLEKLDLRYNQIKRDGFTLPGCSIRY